MNAKVCRFLRKVATQAVMSGRVTAESRYDAGYSGVRCVGWRAEYQRLKESVRRNRAIVNRTIVNRTDMDAQMRVERAVKRALRERAKLKSRREIKEAAERLLRLSGILGIAGS